MNKNAHSDSETVAPILDVRCLTHIGGKCSGHLFPNNVSLFFVLDYLFDPRKTLRGIQSRNWYVTYPLSGYGSKFMLVHIEQGEGPSITDLRFIDDRDVVPVLRLELNKTTTLQHVLYAAYSGFRGISFQELHMSVLSDSLMLKHKPLIRKTAPS